MKLFYLLLITSAFFTTAAAQGVSKTNADPLQLKETEFNFGKIPQGKPVTHYFEISNAGKTPLLIETVEATCGCTTPEWSQAPIAPGAGSKIKVGFNASSEGHFRKNITVFYNDGKVKTLVISGEVYPSPTTSAPLNPSLSLLKQ